MENILQILLNVVFVWDVFSASSSQLFVLTTVIFETQIAKYEYVMQIAWSFIIFPFKYCILRNKTCLYMAFPGSVGIEYNAKLKNIWN